MQYFGSEEKLVDLEYKLFLEIRDKISKEILRIQKTAEIIGTLDVLASFANVAEAQNYVMPVVDNSGEINIEEGRHPVIEKMLSAGEFVPNDTYMNKSSDRLRSNHRTQYGRKIYIHETSSTNNINGTNRLICPSKICKNRSSGQNLHKSRSIRRPKYGTEHLHGRNDGGRKHTKKCNFK